MKPLLSSLLVATAVFAASPALEVVPGQRVGPLSLGAKGPVPAPLKARLEAGKIVELEVPLPQSLAVGGRQQVFEPLALAQALGTCGVVQINEGGTIIDCDGARLVLGASPALRVLSNPRPARVCTAYLSPGATVKLTPASVVCDVDGGAWTTEATPAALVNHRGCKTTEARGGTSVTCGARTFSFAGPTLRLSEVSETK
jgi:hypothetical protein